MDSDLDIKITENKCLKEVAHNDGEAMDVAGRSNLQEKDVLLLYEIKRLNNENERKYLAIINKMNADREEEKIKNDLKLEKDRNDAKKELKEERDEGRLNILNIESKYEMRIQKLETQREELRRINDLRLEKDRKELKTEMEKEINRILKEKEEERNRSIKLEAKLEELERKFELERKEFKKEKDDWLKFVESLPNINSIVNKESNNINEENEESKDEHKVEDDDNIIIVNNNKPVDWQTFILNSCLLKLESFGFTFVVSVASILLLCLFVEKDFGLINVLTSLHNTNHFFASLVLARLICCVGGFILMAPKVNDLDYIFFFSYTALLWIAVSVFSSQLFPQLTGKFFDTENNTETAPPAVEKILLLLLLSISNFVSQFFGLCSYHFICLFLYPSVLPAEIRNNHETNKFKFIIFRTLKVEGFINFVIWFLFCLIIGIGSVPFIPQLSSDQEILIFGYGYPLLKASVTSLCSFFLLWISKLYKWPPVYTSKMVSVFCGISVLVCSLSQLYFVFKNAYNYPFFLNQYVPHEIIKKLSWLTFHPLYLKTKLQVMHIIKKVYESTCKKKYSVKPIDEGKRRRFTVEVEENMDAVAGEIIGRQIGEDACMLIMMIWMTPLAQSYLFPQYYAIVSTPFPSYENIGVMIISSAYGLEVVLTIACFTVLQSVGIPLMTNRHALEMHFKSYVMYVCCISTLLLVLTATTQY